jgi:NTE family protein
MSEEQLQNGVGLALSGGGFRATLFNLGALWRLNEFGWLPKLNRICSVSGGSITAGLLGFKWKKLVFNADGVASNFEQEVVQPLRRFCTLTIDVPCGFRGVIPFMGHASDCVAGTYRKELFGKATLQDLPANGQGPQFIIYATSLQTGASFRFSQEYLAD